MQRRPKHRITKRTKASYLLAAGAIIVAFVWYFGTARIAHVTLALRGSFPASTPTIPLPFSRPGRLDPSSFMVPAKITSTLFLGLPHLQPQDCTSGTLRLGLDCLGFRGTPATTQDNIRLPFSRPSTDNSAFFTVTAEIIRPTVLSSGWLRLAPDGCIESIQVNGADVAEVRHADHALRCWPRIYLVDTSPYLHAGRNEVKINIINVATTKGRYGIDIAGVYTYALHAVLATATALTFVSLCVLLLGSLPRRLKKRICDYMAVIGFPVTGLMSLLALGWLQRGFIEPAEQQWWMPVITDPVAYLVTVPLAFVIWLHTGKSDRPFQRRLSLPACLLSLWGFTMAAGFASVTNVATPAYYVNTFALAGTMAGLFARISLKECWSYAALNRDKTLVALFAAGTSACYQFFDKNLWHHLCHSDALTVYWLLKSLGMDIAVKAGTGNISIYSPHFVLHIYQFCSGLEGIFIFLFLLSAIFILDWPLFQTMPLLEIYLIGFIYMFLANVLRIATLFSIAYYAWQPNASPFLISLRHTPLDIVHSVAGMVYYFIASAVFAAGLYKVATALRQPQEHGTAPHQRQAVARRCLALRLP